MISSGIKSFAFVDINDESHYCILFVHIMHLIFSSMPLGQKYPNNIGGSIGSLAFRFAL
jgi:hypothetical protein